MSVNYEEAKKTSILCGENSIAINCDLTKRKDIEETFDLIHSMEVFYYFNNPKKVISHIVKNWLNETGEMIMGIDFYKENSKSHSWPNDLNTHMELLGISDWVEIFEASGLKQVTSFQTNAKNDFPGTLVVHGMKGKS